MKQTVFVFCVCSFVGLTLEQTPAFAQPRAQRREAPRPAPALPPPQSNPPPQTTPPPAPPAQANNVGQANVCSQRRAILTQDEQRLDRAKSDLAGANAELAQLKRRMDELNAARAGSERLVAVYTERVVASQRSFDASCANDPNCPVHQSAGEDINRRAKLVENALIAVSTEMSKNKTSIDTLEKNIEPLRREYAEKRCNNLIAGETQQATIDRCAALFSDWNRLQAELNLDNRELAGLKSRYEQLLSEFRSLDVRAQENQKLVAAACKVPPAPQPGQLPPPARSNFDDVRRRADNMGRELDAMINTVGRLRGIQITVEGK